MKKTNGSKDVTDLKGVDEGWRVQVYDRDRRLICLLEPSHGWTFFLGCVAGFLIAAIGFSRTAPTPPPSINPPAENAPLQME
ncbi:MAG: hypothetical protein ACFB0C_09025 [Leptolyngbyaceae cyanobacterium]